jgi:hypothetical protein
MKSKMVLEDKSVGLSKWLYCLIVLVCTPAYIISTLFLSLIFLYYTIGGLAIPLLFLIHLSTIGYWLIKIKPFSTKRIWTSNSTLILIVFLINSVGSVYIQTYLLSSSLSSGNKNSMYVNLAGWMTLLSFILSICLYFYILYGLKKQVTTTPLSHSPYMPSPNTHTL